MSYDAIESSVDSGRPLFCYQFVLGTTVWRYTSAAVDVRDADDNVWLAVPISDDGVKQTGEAVSDALTIRAPFTLGPVQVHMSTPPAENIQVSIHRKHVDDDEMVVVYSGEVRQVNFPVPGQATITCETTGASMQRDGLRLGWQRGCPYALYDPLTCKVDKALHAVTLRVMAISGFTITTDVADVLDDGHFAGGFIQWTHPVRGTEYRGIEAHTGLDLLIFGMTDDLYEGMVVTAYPGCPRTTAACIEKFNNLPNYGGIPHMPGKSPFDGTPVF